MGSTHGWVEGNVHRGRWCVHREPHDGFLLRPALADDGVGGPRDGNATGDLPELGATLQAEGIPEGTCKNALGHVELGALVEVTQEGEGVLGPHLLLDANGAGELQGVHREGHACEGLGCCDAHEAPLAQGGIQRNRGIPDRGREGDCVGREDARKIEGFAAVPDPSYPRSLTQLRGEEPIVCLDLRHVAQDEVVGYKTRMTLWQPHRRPN
mmetsp:Transcript_2471/g.6214  ORF Transcript_2471/g.6214 Transcript_2471/m.6214 type:complete len:211 (+) Transcript_2471:253-885(+)